MQDYAPPPDVNGASQYRLGVGDMVSVRVFNQESLTTRERVRPDGMISMQFLHDVLALGLTPAALAAQIQTKLKEYINAPVVTVSLEEKPPLIVPVVGEVSKQGQYSLERGAGVLEALAAAGGLTEFAHRDRIFVLRRRPAAVRIRATFEALSRGDQHALAFQLQPGDSVVVE